METIQAFGELESKLNEAQIGVTAGTINPAAGAGTAPKLAATGQLSTRSGGRVPPSVTDGVSASNLAT